MRLLRWTSIKYNGRGSEARGCQFQWCCTGINSRRWYVIQVNRYYPLNIIQIMAKVVAPLVDILQIIWPRVSGQCVTTVTSDHPVPYCLIASTRLLSVYSMYSPFPFLSICLVVPPIGERVVRSVSLYNYLICFLSCFRSLYVPVPCHY